MNNKTLNTDTANVLKQLIRLLEQLNYDEYSAKHSILSNGSIGGHVRHTIELFQQLFIGYSIGEINYDNRKRDIRLEEDIEFAIDSLATIIVNLRLDDKTLRLGGLHLGNQSIESTYRRELLYNLEHCIHHQALIKVALLSQGKINIPDSFGIAKSTLMHRKACAV